MRLEYLRYFDHLAEVLNYTRAAEDLYIAQPTLSSAMKRLEKELGHQIVPAQRGVGAYRAYRYGQGVSRICIACFE